MALIVVTGSPGVGKSTWVRTVAKPGDIRFDGDALTNLLTGKKAAKHHHDGMHKLISKAAREAGIVEAIKHKDTLDVYVLVSNLNREDEQKWRGRGARFVIIDPGHDVAMQRCRENRPGYKQRLVTAWYNRRGEWPKDAEIVRDFTPTEELGQDEHTASVPDSRPARLHVVTGPPASGKSTFVREHRQPGDVTIDYDLLANVLAGVDAANHEHMTHIKAITKAARQAAIDSALKQPGGHAVWLIHSSPAESTLRRYRSLGAEIHVVDPGKDVVMSRVKAQRPAHLLPVAAAWYGSKPTGVTTARGYGWDHQRYREALMRRHSDGTSCYWCGLPMYRQKDRNWDGKPLAADHEDEGGAKQGKPPNRLLHGNCNSQRQDGRHDDRRPAVTGKHPSGPLAAAEVRPAAVRDWSALC